MKRQYETKLDYTNIDRQESGVPEKEEEERKGDVLNMVLLPKTSSRI